MRRNEARKIDCSLPKQVHSSTGDLRLPLFFFVASGSARRFWVYRDFCPIPGIKHQPAPMLWLVGTWHWSAISTASDYATCGPSNEAANTTALLCKLVAAPSRRSLTSVPASVRIQTSVLEVIAIDSMKIAQSFTVNLSILNELWKFLIIACYCLGDPIEVLDNRMIDFWS